MLETERYESAGWDRTEKKSSPREQLGKGGRRQSVVGQAPSADEQWLLAPLRKTSCKERSRLIEKVPCMHSSIFFPSLVT